MLPVEKISVGTSLTSETIEDIILAVLINAMRRHGSKLMDQLFEVDFRSIHPEVGDQDAFRARVISAVSLFNVRVEEHCNHVMDSHLAKWIAEYGNLVGCTLRSLVQQDRLLLMKSLANEFCGSLETAMKDESGIEKEYRAALKIVSKLYDEIDFHKCGINGSFT